MSNYESLIYKSLERTDFSWITRCDVLKVECCAAGPRVQRAHRPSLFHGVGGHSASDTRFHTGFYDE